MMKAENDRRRNLCERQPPWVTGARHQSPSSREGRAIHWSRASPLELRSAGSSASRAMSSMVFDSRSVNPLPNVVASHAERAARALIRADCRIAASVCSMNSTCALTAPRSRGRRPSQPIGQSVVDDHQTDKRKSNQQRHTEHGCSPHPQK
jgi:hypothetical protein